MSDDRIARFEERRAELSALSDEQLKEHFWTLCAQLVDPIVALARTHTSPSIERSVLLRMGVDSLTSQAVVKRVYEAGLRGMGAGHVVLNVAERRGCDVRTAANAILEDAAILHGLALERTPR